MKFRSDFVTNSSSTSFLIIAKKEFTKEDFFKAFGVSTSSPLIGLFENFYKILMNAASDRPIINTSIFPEEMVKKISTAYQQGDTVLHGTLSSDGGLLEMTLCTEPFKTDSNSFEIYAMDCFW